MGCTVVACARFSSDSLTRALSYPARHYEHQPRKYDERQGNIFPLFVLLCDDLPSVQ